MAAGGRVGDGIDGGDKNDKDIDKYGKIEGRKGCVLAADMIHFLGNRRREGGKRARNRLPLRPKKGKGRETGWICSNIRRGCPRFCR